MHWPLVPQTAGEPKNMQKLASGAAQLVSVFFE